MSDCLKKSNESDEEEEGVCEGQSNECGGGEVKAQELGWPRVFYATAADYCFAQALRRLRTGDARARHWVADGSASAAGPG